MNVPRIISFDVVRRRLAHFGVKWNKTRGKGADGVFEGADRSGQTRLFTIGHQRQRKGLYRSHVNDVRRRFGLVPPKVSDEQFWGDEF